MGPILAFLALLVVSLTFDLQRREMIESRIANEKQVAHLQDQVFVMKKTQEINRLEIMAEGLRSDVENKLSKCLESFCFSDNPTAEQLINRLESRIGFANLTSNTLTLREAIACELRGLKDLEKVPTDLTRLEELSITILRVGIFGELLGSMNGYQRIIEAITKADKDITSSILRDYSFTRLHKYRSIVMKLYTMGLATETDVRIWDLKSHSLYSSGVKVKPDERTFDPQA